MLYRNESTEFERRWLERIEQRSERQSEWKRLRRLQRHRRLYRPGMIALGLCVALLAGGAFLSSWCYCYTFCSCYSLALRLAALLESEKAPPPGQLLCSSIVWVDLTITLLLRGRFAGFSRYWRRVWRGHLRYALQGHRQELPVLPVGLPFVI